MSERTSTEVRTFEDILRNQPLDAGSHSPGTGACVMEKVAILWALHTGQNPLEVWTDLPECTNQVIAKTAQAINDHLDTEQRQRLNALIPRLLRARRTESDVRVNVRLALFAARSVLHLARDEDCERAVEAVETWLLDPSADNAWRAANAANAANAAAHYAAYAAANAAYAAANAANAAAHYAAYAAANAANAAAHYAAYAHYAATAAEMDPILFLDQLLDAWEEAVTKEGEDLYIPREWEDEALAFVAEYMESQDA